MISVLIADDHDIVRTGLRRILETEKDIEVVGEAGNGRETIDECGKTKPDVVLLDLDMPGIDGLEAIPQILSLQPNTKILVLTMHDNEEYAIRALKSGASGFLLKGSSAKELPDAIRKVHSGKTHIASSIMERMAMRHCTPVEENPLSMLSSREFQILAGLARGLKLDDIAGELNISISTVATHKKRIKDKFGLKKNVDIMRFADKYGVIDKKPL